jgi:serine/threonine-protein kinase
MIDRVQEIGGQLISGIRYLHDCNIIHQDLKPQNIIFKNLEYDTIKLIDLGVSNRLEETREHTSAATAGTMRYMPPE